MRHGFVHVWLLRLHTLKNLVTYLHYAALLGWLQLWLGLPSLQHHFAAVYVVQWVGGVFLVPVTLYVTSYWNSNSCSSSSHFCFQDPCFISNTFIFPILTLWSVLGTPYTRPCLTFPVPCPFPVYPDRRFYNPVSDLLIPLLCSQPCTILSSYKSKPPMYSRVSLNID